MIQGELFPTSTGARRGAGPIPSRPRGKDQAALARLLESAPRQEFRAAHGFSAAQVRRLMTPLPRITVPGWG